MEIPTTVKKSLWEALKALLYAAIGLITASATGCMFIPVL